MGEIVKRIAEVEAERRTPVVAISASKGYGKHSSILRSIDLGAEKSKPTSLEGTIIKPVDVTVTTERVFVVNDITVVVDYFGYDSVFGSTPILNKKSKLVRGYIEI